MLAAACGLALVFFGVIDDSFHLHPFYTTTHVAGVDGFWVVAMRREPGLNDRPPRGLELLPRTVIELSHLFRHPGHGNHRTGNGPMSVLIWNPRSRFCSFIPSTVTMFRVLSCGTQSFRKAEENRGIISSGVSRYGLNTGFLPPPIAHVSLLLPCFD